jgi:hypothetical protein
VVAANRPARHAAHELYARVRVGSVADDVAEEQDLFHAKTREIREHGSQGREVGVDVADDAVDHGST